jgi:hypothetical protein
MPASKDKTRRAVDLALGGAADGPSVPNLFWVGG